MTDDPKRLVYEVKMMLSSVASHGPAALTTTDDPMYTANLLARLRDALVARTTPPTDDEHEALDHAIRVPVSELRVSYRPLWRLIGDIKESVLAAGYRRQGPITDAMALRAEEERESHRYTLLDTPANPIQARCTCGWVGPYAGEWRLHRERAALEAAERAR